MYDNKTKFDLIGRDFDGRGTQIKSIDCNSTRMNISLRCDILNPSNILERRDEIIDDLLNNVPVDFCLTVHDSLLVKKEDSDKVLEWCIKQRPDIRFTKEMIKRK
jgi:hypothetical protein